MSRKTWKAGISFPTAGVCCSNTRNRSFVATFSDRNRRPQRRCNDRSVILRKTIDVHTVLYTTNCTKTTMRWRRNLWYVMLTWKHGGGTMTSDRSSALHVKTETCTDDAVSHRSQSHLLQRHLTCKTDPSHQEKPATYKPYCTPQTAR